MSGQGTERLGQIFKQFNFPLPPGQVWVRVTLQLTASVWDGAGWGVMLASVPSDTSCSFEWRAAGSLRFECLIVPGPTPLCCIEGKSPLLAPLGPGDTGQGQETPGSAALASCLLAVTELTDLLSLCFLHSVHSLVETADSVFFALAAARSLTSKKANRGNLVLILQV